MPSRLPCDRAGRVKSGRESAADDVRIVTRPVPAEPKEGGSSVGRSMRPVVIGSMPRGG